MPKFLETRLKAEYGQNSKIPYAIMNAKGYMYGSAITPKGEALERKHEADMAAGTTRPVAHIRSAAESPKPARRMHGDGADHWSKH